MGMTRLSCRDGDNAQGSSSSGEIEWKAEVWQHGTVTSIKVGPRSRSPAMLVPLPDASYGSEKWPTAARGDAARPTSSPKPPANADTEHEAPAARAIYRGLAVFLFVFGCASAAASA